MVMAKFASTQPDVESHTCPLGSAPTSVSASMAGSGCSAAAAAASGFAADPASGARSRWACPASGACANAMLACAELELPPPCSAWRAWAGAGAFALMEYPDAGFVPLLASSVALPAAALVHIGFDAEAYSIAASTSGSGAGAFALVPTPGAGFITRLPINDALPAAALVQIRLDPASLSPTARTIGSGAGAGRLAVWRPPGAGLPGSG